MRRRAIPCLLLLLASCRSRVDGYPRNWYADGSFSAIPGVGLGIGAGKVVARTGKLDLAGEAQFVWHAFDDKNFADDGFADHGGMTAVRVGVKHATNPGHKRHVTYRYGFQFYRATGEPGLVDFPGDYYGAYFGFGFETDLSARWTMGPEVSVALLEGEGDLGFEAVPTFFWHLSFNW
jgi:hypothetical protein